MSTDPLGSAPNSDGAAGQGSASSMNTSQLHLFVCIEMIHDLNRAHGQEDSATTGSTSDLQVEQAAVAMGLLSVWQELYGEDGLDGHAVGFQIEAGSRRGRGNGYEGSYGQGVVDWLLLGVGALFWQCGLGMSLGIEWQEEFEENI